MEKKKERIAEANTRPVAKKIKDMMRTGHSIGEAVAAGLREGGSKRTNSPKDFARRRR